MRTRIKFCGCTNVHDAILAVQTGADAIGMIFAESPRRIDEHTAREIARELPPFITPVGVFADPQRGDIDRIRAIFPDLVVQLHGDEAPSFVSSLDAKVIKAIHIAPGGGDGDGAAVEEAARMHPRAILLFDTSSAGGRGGTGIPFNWRTIAPIAHERQILVGGGLTPENVSSCVRTVRPFGVDVRNGIETGGKKDPFKMRAFVQAVKETDAA